jgi:hypothetical protein
VDCLADCCVFEDESCLILWLSRNVNLGVMGVGAGIDLQTEREEDWPAP